MAQINKPTDYFNTKLYTGDGASTLAITGVGFQPDFTWIKVRTLTHNHVLFDSVRGATKTLESNLTNAENTRANSLKSFDSDGFTLGDWDNVNDASDTFVSWNWLGANATVGHGLGSTPKMIIVKNRESVYDWRVYHQSLGSTKYLNLNTDGGFGTATSIWNDTNPTSSVFSIGDSPRVNESGIGFIAYCFAEKKGFSKFGSYTGNGNVDSPFIYLGFKPAFMIFKRTDSAVDWTMYDNKRIGYNPNNYKLRPNLSNAEYSTAGYFEADIVSNGFKIRTSDAEVNTSGGTYIYMAFAENPFTTSTGIPTTAR